MAQWVKIPENLDIDTILISAEIKANTHTGDKIAVFCHMLHLTSCNHRDLYEKNDRPYFPLNSKILQYYIKDYFAIETLLIQSKVIEKQPEKYKIGHKSYYFRFSVKYYGVKYKQYDVQFNGLHNKLMKYNQKDPLPDYPNTKPYVFLKKFWKNGKLKMDVTGALQWIDTTYQIELNEIEIKYEGIKPTNKTKSKLKNKELKKLIEKTEIWKTSVENFNLKRILFTADDFSKRLHTKLTNLKKELRAYVTYDGKPLVSLDIKNSQPYLSLVLFNENFWRERSKSGQTTLLYNEVGLSKINKDIVNNNYDTIKLAKTSESLAGKGFEFDIFCELASTGKIYDYLIDQFKDYGMDYDRDMVKRQFLIFLYHNPIELYKSTEGYASINLITDLFPNISKLFLQLKELGSFHYEPPEYKENYTPKYQFPYHPLTAKESFKFPPQLLQRIESYLVIEVVCKQLNKGNKDIPLFTIHDSIVTTTEFANLVKDKMIFELKKAIGFEPKIKIEGY